MNAEDEAYQRQFEAQPLSPKMSAFAFKWSQRAWHASPPGQTSKDSMQEFYRELEGALVTEMGLRYPTQGGNR